MRGQGHAKLSKPTLDSVVSWQADTGAIWAVATGHEDLHWSSASWEAPCPGPTQDGGSAASCHLKPAAGVSAQIAGPDQPCQEETAAASRFRVGHVPAWQTHPRLPFSGSLFISGSWREAAGQCGQAGTIGGLVEQSPKGCRSVSLCHGPGSRVSATQYHRLGGRTSQRWGLTWIWRPESGIRSSAGPSLFEAPGRLHPQPPSHFWVFLEIPGIPGQVDVLIQSLPFAFTSASLFCVFSPFFRMRTPCH